MKLKPSYNDYIVILGQNLWPHKRVPSHLKFEVRGLIIQVAVRTGFTDNIVITYTPTIVPPTLIN